MVHARGPSDSQRISLSNLPMAPAGAHGSSHLVIGDGQTRQALYKALSSGPVAAKSHPDASLGATSTPRESPTLSEGVINTEAGFNLVHAHFKPMTAAGPLPKCSSASWSLHGQPLPHAQRHILLSSGLPPATSSPFQSAVPLLMRSTELRAVVLQPGARPPRPGATTRDPALPIPAQNARLWPPRTRRCLHPLPLPLDLAWDGCRVLAAPCPAPNFPVFLDGDRFGANEMQLGPKAVLGEPSLEAAARCGHVSICHIY